ncbi:hypothetical protein RJT34_31965 [Clitoria ternatea]|uniref:TF-B3 domain-containing protein n=1 Tax=Clitoria ternatea TaxID=43366 RepID=A0AAN9EWU0_CLITE
MPNVLGHNMQKVPPEFLKHLNEDITSKETDLIGPSGDKWHVTIVKKGNDIYMQNGWSQFLKDNLVMLDEFLLFKYHGENCFQVQIFGKNGCERLFLQKTRQEPSKKKNRQGTSADLPFSNQVPLSKDFPKLEISTEIDRPDASKLAECNFPSSNPCFKQLMTKCNVEDRCMLPIATEFARKYVPEEVKNMILWNSEGKSWEVTVTNFRNRNKIYSQFSKGWREFVHGNKLKRGDTCMFELEGRTNLRVHIFRCEPN